MLKRLATLTLFLPLFLLPFYNIIGRNTHNFEFYP